jgi:hypothetical protein
MDTFTTNCEKSLHGYDADFFLGPSSKRYFGTGFKKTEHGFLNLRKEEECLFADLMINWPETWAEKKGVNVTPHIGTLDFFLASVTLVEEYFSIVREISIKQMNHMWISDFICKTGNKCIEQNNLSCSCRLIFEECNSSKTIFVFEIKIGDTCVSLSIDFPNNLSPMYYKSPQLLEQRTYYSQGYKCADRRISNIKVDFNRKSITADYALRHQDNLTYYGIGAEYMPCITLCDLILIAGQLTQILLYSLDGTSREASSNLWMRKIHCSYKKPIVTDPEVLIEIRKSTNINMKGEMYHCSDLRFDFNNGYLIADCSSAYKPFIK